MSSNTQSLACGHPIDHMGADILPEFKVILYSMRLLGAGLGNFPWCCCCCCCKLKKKCTFRVFMFALWTVFLRILFSLIVVFQIVYAALVFFTDNISVNIFFQTFALNTIIVLLNYRKFNANIEGILNLMQEISQHNRNRFKSKLFLLISIACTLVWLLTISLCYFEMRALLEWIESGHLYLIECFFILITIQSVFFSGTIFFCFILMMFLCYHIQQLFAKLESKEEDLTSILDHCREKGEMFDKLNRLFSPMILFWLTSVFLTSTQSVYFIFMFHDSIYFFLVYKRFFAVYTVINLICTIFMVESASRVSKEAENITTVVYKRFRDGDIPEEDFFAANRFLSRPNACGMVVSAWKAFYLNRHFVLCYLSTMLSVEVLLYSFKTGQNE